MSPLATQSLPSYLPATQPPKLQPWEVFKELSKVKPGKSAGPDGIPAKLVHLFAAELSTPLCDVLNTSFAEGTPPQQWKQAIVVPVPKDQPPRLERLRPIALTDHFAKIAEQFMSKWLLADIDHLLDKSQFGSRAGRSTGHYLTDLVNCLCQSAEKPRNTSTVIATDFSQAFDKVDHNVVIKKLIDLEAHAYIVKWVADFLTDRTQRVRYRGNLSEITTLKGGVPQGTKLGPILFLVLVNDALSTSNLKHLKYVDDITIVESRPRDAVSEVHQTLNTFSSWCNENGMLLNASKCSVMRVDFGRQARIPLNIELNNHTLTEVDVMKILGVYLQADLKWNSQVSSMLKKASKRMHILRSLIPFRLPNDDLLLIYKGYIRPLVEYAVPVWHSGLTTAQTNKLEGIQKRALKLILGYRYNSYANALVMTSLESLQERRVNICCKFGKSLLNSKEFQHWLPQPRLEQSLQERRVETFVVNLANHSSTPKNSSTGSLNKSFKTCI